jgi:uncharacterized membrane protein
MNLFSQPAFFMILRWLHFFFGVMWIGHLYYFNFTQTNFLGKADAGLKSGVTRVVTPEALYWFRWGAMWTMVTGVIYLGMYAHQFSTSMGMSFFHTGYGVAITTGAVLGVTMWANVWFVIWPNQKVIIANAEQTANGGAAIPAAAQLAVQAKTASRTNTLFSIPLLFFMGAASHFAPSVSESSSTTGYWIVFLIIWAALEGNALKGKTGPMETVKGLITCGFVLTAVIFVVMSCFL